MDCHRFLVLTTVLACSAVAAYAAEIEGKVVKIDGDRVEISLRGPAVAQAGDSVEVFYVIPGAQIEATAAKGKVAEVREGTALVTILSRTSPIQRGYSARIVSTSPAQPATAATLPARAADVPPRSVKLVQVRSYSGLANVVWQAAFSPDGRRCYACDHEGTVIGWDVASGERFLSAKHGGAVLALAVTPDGRHLYCGSADKTIRCWDALGGGEVRSLEGVVAPCWGLTVSSTGRVVGEGAGATAAWDPASGRCLYRQTTGANAFAFLPDGKTFLGGGLNVLTLRSAETGEEVRKFEGCGAWIRCVAVSSDGKYAVTGHGNAGDSLPRTDDDYSVRLWETATGRMVHRFTGPKHSVFGVGFSRDGQLVLATSLDGSLRLWSATTFAPIAQTEDASAVYCLAVAPQGQFVLTGGAGGKVDLWRMQDY